MAEKKTFADFRSVLLQDGLLSVLASLLALLLMRWLTEPIPGFSDIVVRWLGIALIASVTGFLLTGSYRAVRRFVTVRSMAKIVVAMVTKVAILSLALLFRIVPVSSLMEGILLLLVDLLFSLLFLLYIRISARLFSNTGDEQVSAVVGKKNVLIAGTGPASVSLANEVKKTGTFNVLGLLTRERNVAGRVIDDWVVYFCEDWQDIDSLQWRLGGVDGILFPNEQGGERATLHTVAKDHPVHDGMGRVGRAVKRTSDSVAAALLLLLFSPLIGLCALAVKLEDRGKVFFAQERIGLRGRPFSIYKFRSMREDAETQGSPQLFSGDADPRLTRVGRFLRAHHLDELPQLWNVLRGDMSFIGYRPERAYYIAQIMERNPRYRYLYQIRPGVTSYATLYNGYTDTLEKMLTRLDLDLYYLRNRSLWFDVKVLGLTFLNIAFGRKF